MRIFSSVLVVSFLFVTSCSNSNDSDGSGNGDGVSKALEVCPSQEGTPDCQSFAMTLTGRDGGLPNANDVAAIKGAMGGLITNTKIKKYVLMNEYAGGGFQACFEPVANGGYNAVADAFGVFRVGDFTLWQITLVRNCNGL
jgi:hypothetical protein